MYLILGLSTTLYFGTKLKSAVNLNFAGFHWGLDYKQNVPPVLKIIELVR